MFSEKGRKKIEELERNKILISNHPIRVFLLYSDLQNPLLVKYNFEPSEFLKGAEHAFLTIQKGIVSKDFYNFATGYFIIFYSPFIKSFI